MNRNPDTSERETLTALTRLVSDDSPRTTSEPTVDAANVDVVSVETERCHRVTRLLCGESAREFRERNA